MQLGTLEFSLMSRLLEKFIVQHQALDRWSFLKKMWYSVSVEVKHGNLVTSNPGHKLLEHLPFCALKPTISTTSLTF